MTREDLKDYLNNKEYIKDKMEELIERGTELNRMNAILSDMPKREQKSRRQHGRTISNIYR